MRKPKGTLMLYCSEQNCFVLNVDIAVVVLAEPLYEGKAEVLCNYGGYNSMATVANLHDMPASIKRKLKEVRR